jgi:hypothetical protein
VTTIESSEPGPAEPDTGPAASAPPTTAAMPGALRAAAIASLGAGAIHAAAAGAHSEHRGVVIAFAITAALQIGWGALALVRAGLLVSLAGAAVNLGIFGGWVLAKTTGIGFIDGLDVKESPQFADSLAAGLAAVAVVGALLALAGRIAWAARPHPAFVGVAAVATIALVVPGIVKTGSHSHAGGHDDHGDAAAGHHHGSGDAAAGHDHGSGDAVSVQPAKPYDATLPVDLGGVPGVSPEEQADAEALVTVSLEKLPRFSDIPTIEAMGYHSIGDAGTGFEHFVKWDLIDDGRVLDPDYPESLVFVVDRATGEKTLGAAMYMANADDTLDTVPAVGGDLVQWHVHDNLCYAGEPGRWHVAGIAPPERECPTGTVRLSDNPVPMVHVWIIPHECGPFAALEGVGAGQIAPGEQRLCDHQHGAPT